MKGPSRFAKRLDRCETLKQYFQTDAVSSSGLNQSRDDRKSKTRLRNKPSDNQTNQSGRSRQKHTWGTGNYKITKIVRALWLGESSVCMRVCKHGCGVKLFCFSRANHASTNLKKFSSSKLDKFTLFTHSFVGWNLENRYKEGVLIFFRLSWQFKRGWESNVISYFPIFNTICCCCCCC